MVPVHTDAGKVAQPGLEPGPLTIWVSVLPIKLLNHRATPECVPAHPLLGPVRWLTGGAEASPSAAAYFSPRQHSVTDQGINSR